MDHEKDEGVSSRVPRLGRRDLMKLGVGGGVAMTMPPGAVAPAQQVPTRQTAGVEDGQRVILPPPTGGLEPASVHRRSRVQKWPDIAESKVVVATTQTGYTVHTGPGAVNNSGRAFGNGPMDECSRRLVEFVSSYSEANLTDSLVETINYLMVDTIATIYCGFESEPARINARLAQTMRGDMKCTVLGYGITTTPEMAAFANAAMIRQSDFNCHPHNNEMFGGVLAIGEALHSTGPQVMAALTIAYEVLTALANAGGDPNRVEWDNPYIGLGVTLGVGKLMGLNQDQLANALSLTLTPHMAMYSHSGFLSMWKGMHSAEGVRVGVWGAMLAREGMTGWSMPFEGRDGLIAHIGPFTRDLRLPTSPDGKMAIETIHGKGGGYKRFPADGGTQGYNQVIAPQLIAWTKPEEIASIDVEVSFVVWQETCDPTKWDPRNRETADHSLPYNIARHLIDKQIYLDSFTKEKYMDPVARELMNKITIRPNVDPDFGESTVLTVRKKSGEERVFKSRELAPMSHDEFIQKYNRSADFMHIDKGQADRALKQWMDLRQVKDIGDAIQIIAKFGQPRPLSDRTPARIS